LQSRLRLLRFAARSLLNSGIQQSCYLQDPLEAACDRVRIELVEHMSALLLGRYDSRTRQLPQMTRDHRAILRQTFRDRSDVSAAKQNQFPQDGDARRLAERLEESRIEDGNALLGCFPARKICLRFQSRDLATFSG
jgi:hypothetical protein